MEPHVKINGIQLFVIEHNLINNLESDTASTVDRASCITLIILS